MNQASVMLVIQSLAFFGKKLLFLEKNFENDLFLNGHPQLDVGSAKRVIICGFLLVKSCRFFTD